MSKRPSIRWGAAGLSLLLFLAGVYWVFARTEDRAGGETFDAQRAYADLVYQVELGPRIPGSSSHAAFIDWVLGEFKSAGWDVELQDTVFQGRPVRNVVAFRRGSGGEGWVVLGAHYDSRPQADRDPFEGNRSLPVPGANDGASGVAVLLELARVLPPSTAPDVSIVLFDAEDGGGIDGAGWILGSQAYVQALENKPDAVVIVDMVGDADLTIHPELNSDSALSASLWGAAHDLGYSGAFNPIPKYSMVDDHTPFLQAGIPSALLIDFNYEHWHTTQDTPDKTSPQSLKAVGEVLLAWLQGLD